MQTSTRRTAPLAVLSAIVLALAGCAGGTHDHPLPRAKYRSVLVTEIGPINTAMRSVDSASSSRELTSGITSITRVVRRAARKLERVTPPTAVARQHRRLVKSLRRFPGELNIVDRQVGDRELCTASTTDGRLAELSETYTLKATLGKLAVYTGSDRVRLVPPEQPPPRHRPSSGHFLHGGDRRAGQGTFSIDNNGDSDAVVDLAEQGSTTYEIYVHGRERYTVTGINDGTYTIFVAHGGDWDTKAHAFGSNCAFRKFDQPIVFRTTTTSTEIRYTRAGISTHPVTGGNASTERIAPGDFPPS